MHASRTISLAIIAALGCCAMDAYADTDEGTQSCTREQERANKEAAVKAFGGGFSTFMTSLAPHYKQHNPEFKRFAELNRAEGQQIFHLMGEVMKLTGQGGPPKPVAGQPPGNNQYMVLAQCDLVTVVAQTFEPDPQYPGKFYEAFRFDVFRVENGKIAEHWDGARIPNPVPEYLKKTVSAIRADQAHEPAGKPN